MLLSAGTLLSFEPGSRCTVSVPFAVTCNARICLQMSNLDQYNPPEIFPRELAAAGYPVRPDGRREESTLAPRSAREGVWFWGHPTPPLRRGRNYFKWHPGIDELDDPGRGQIRYRLCSYQ